MNITAAGSKREWTGPKENYLKHHEVIDWWCEGGDVEYCDGVSAVPWNRFDPCMEFELGNEYRIKQREPRSGEVWLIDGDECVFPNGAYIQKSNDVAWVRLDGHGVKNSTSDCFITEYVAPSVESYFMRKASAMFGGVPVDSQSMYDAIRLLKEACRYED